MAIDTTIAVDNVTANSRNNRPTIPPINKSGINTAISEMLIDTTVNPISLAPFKAAANGFIPSSRCRVMFSITTIASSTTKPVEIVSAISDRLSMLYPKRYITANVPINDTGTATAGIKVALPLRRKINTTTITSAMDNISVRSTSLTDARIVVVRSSTIVVSIPFGIDATTEGSSDRI